MRVSVPPADGLPVVARSDRLVEGLGERSEELWPVLGHVPTIFEPDAELAWAREVAIHHLNDVLPDVQSLLWQRVPDYIPQDLQTIAATHVQDVAKLYF